MYLFIFVYSHPRSPSGLKDSLQVNGGGCVQPLSSSGNARERERI